MPEARTTLLKLNPQFGENAPFRYSRETFRTAGVDNWAVPPAQNQDLFELLTNVMPSATGVLIRRYGYRTFYPKLDTGSGDSL